MKISGADFQMKHYGRVETVAILKLKRKMRQNVAQNEQVQRGHEQVLCGIAEIVSLQVEQSSPD